MPKYPWSTLSPIALALSCGYMSARVCPALSDPPPVPSRLPSAPEPPATAVPAESTSTDYTALVESDELDADHDPRPGGPAAPDTDLSGTTGVRFHIGRGQRRGGGRSEMVRRVEVGELWQRVK